MKYFNAGDIDGFCFTCQLRGSEICGKCADLLTKDTPKGQLVENIENDPHFRKLWGAVLKK